MGVMSSRDDDLASSHRNALVFWLSVAQLVSWGCVFYGFSLLMGPVESALDLSRAESSLAFSLALLMEGLLAYPIGRWIDRGHERAVMVGGSLLMGAALAAHSGIQAPWQFYAVWLLLGMGMSATLYPPAFAVLTRRYPTHFRRAIITLTFLGGLASTVFIPLIAWLIRTLGWRESLWVLAALQWLICLPIHALTLRNAPTAHRQPTPHAQAPDLRQHLRSPTFLLLGTFLVLIMGVTSALPAHIVSLLRESGMAESWAIMVPASIGVLQVLGRLLLYFFEAHLDVHQANRWIPCLIVLGLVVLLLGGHHPAWAMVFVACYGLGNGMVTIVKGTAIAMYVSRPLNASLNGALGVPLALARATAPWLMGVLWSAQAGYRWGLGVMSALGVVAVMALWWAQAHALRQPDGPA
jgi:MFS family permease